MSEEVDINSDKSLGLARHYAMLLDPIPTRVLFALKTLRANYLTELESGDTAIKAGSYASIKLIDKIPSFKVPIYFAAAHLFPDRFVEAEDDTTKALMNILRPGLFGSLLALVYLYRRVGKLSKHDVWEELAQDVLIDMELGFLLGKAIDRIGPADGLLIGGVRQLALATFMLRDAETYRRYRNSKKGVLDIEYEHTKYGCDHSQVAMYILYIAGYWKSRSGGNLERSPLTIRDALRGTFPRSGSDDPELERWSNTIYWIDRIRNNVSELKAANFEDTGDETLTDLLNKSKEIIENGSSFQWMNRGYSDPAVEETIQKQKNKPADVENVAIEGIENEELKNLDQEDVDSLQEYADEYSRSESSAQDTPDDDNS